MQFPKLLPFYCVQDFIKYVLFKTDRSQSSKINVKKLHDTETVKQSQ